MVHQYFQSIQCKIIFFSPSPNVQEIVNDPKFCVEDFSRFDIRQGELGNCWLIAAMSSLTMHPKLLAQAIPNDQDFNEDYVGAFRFR